MWCGAPLLALAYSGFPNAVARVPRANAHAARDITLTSALGAVDGVTAHSRLQRSHERGERVGTGVDGACGHVAHRAVQLTSRLTLNVTRGATLLRRDERAGGHRAAPSYGQGVTTRGLRRTSFLHGVRLRDLVLTGGGD